MIPLIFAVINLIAFAGRESIADVGNVSSTHADYDGDTLILKGNVLVEHMLGNMRADVAYLEKQEAVKDFPFSKISLLQNVVLSLKDKASLKGDKAHFDFSTLKGEVLGKVVEYTDRLKQGSTEVPLKLTASSLNLDMRKKINDFEIAEITANTCVEIVYDTNTTLRAEHAHFNKDDSSIIAYPQENCKCHVTHDQNILEADKIVLDVSNQTLELDAPSGIVFSFPRLEKPEIHFTAKKLFWDYKNKILSLKENVDLQESTIGAIKANTLVQDPSSLVLEGDVRLFSKEEQNRFAMADKLTYTPNAQTILLTSNSDKKVLFVDEEQSLHISASEIQILRDPKTKKDSVKGVGNVRFSFNKEEIDALKTHFPEFEEPHGD